MSKDSDSSDKRKSRARLVSLVRRLLNRSEDELDEGNPWVSLVYLALAFLALAVLVDVMGWLDILPI